MTRILRRQAARRDLVDIFRYHAREAGPRVADRFHAEVEATLSRLAKLPGIGARFDQDHPALAEIRHFPVSRFRNYLIFYRPLDDGIEVIRVLNGARDIHPILMEEFGIDEDADDAPLDA